MMNGNSNGKEEEDFDPITPNSMVVNIEEQFPEQDEVDESLQNSPKEEDEEENNSKEEVEENEPSNISQGTNLLNQSLDEIFKLFNEVIFLFLYSNFM